jgi:putative nucleotidyltransferase with HDIG domain
VPSLSLDDVLKREPSLPARPEIVATVLELTRSRSTSMSRIAQAIAQDPSIAARVLRMANSSLYGFPHRVATLDHAVVLLGLDTVRDLVVASAILRRFEGADGGLDLQGFWRHSFAVGILARILTRSKGVAESERQFLYGLLHDTGKLLLATVAPDEYKRTREIVATGVPVLEAERRFIGVEHTRVGAALFEKWGLPSEYAQVAAYHHDPTNADPSTALSVAATHVANGLARAAVLGDEQWLGPVSPIMPEALLRLGASTDTFPELVAEAADALDEAAESFGVQRETVAE